MGRRGAAFDAMLMDEDHFRVFFSRIEAPALRDIARHWNEARRDRRMPSWNDIDPTAIKAHLPIVWSWRYDRASDSFTGRLIGQTISELFGKSIRGIKMSEYYPDEETYGLVYERCHRVVTGPCFSRDNGLIFQYQDRVGLGERVMFPLAEDGEHGDGVFGATAYDIAQHIGGEPVRYATGFLEYYPL